VHEGYARRRHHGFLTVQYRPADQLGDRSQVEIGRPVDFVVQADAVPNNVASEVRAADRHPDTQLAFQSQPVGEPVKAQEGRFQADVVGAQAEVRVACRNIGAELEGGDLTVAQEESELEASIQIGETGMIGIHLRFEEAYRQVEKAGQLVGGSE